jgi:choline dehydrogenase-like flavoprotein
MPSLSEAAATGRLLCRQGAAVRHIELDSKSRASGVVFYDHRSRAYKRANASLVFVAASTLESTRILLSSQSSRNPCGIGARSGALGHFLMDHVSVKVEGVGPPLRTSTDSENFGQCIYLPRFDLRNDYGSRASRGFGVRVYRLPNTFGSSYFTAVADSEMLPRASNRVMLSKLKDAWGLPTLRIEAAYGDEEIKNAREQGAALEELAALARARLRAPAGDPGAPGSAIHECGTARMGDDPSNSVLDPFNEAWEAPGLYVTDGAAFPSEGIQNPTLTIMALTARACDHAVRST